MGDQQRVQSLVSCIGFSLEEDFIKSHEEDILLLKMRCNKDEFVS